MPKLTRERIACCAIAVHMGAETVYDIIPVTQLVMDRVNWYMKNRPYTRIEYKEFFVTTHGRVLEDIEAFDIAFNANQLINDKAKPPLRSIDLWDYKKG